MGKASPRTTFNDKALQASIEVVTITELINCSKAWLGELTNMTEKTNGLHYQLTASACQLCSLHRTQQLVWLSFRVAPFSYEPLHCGRWNDDLGGDDPGGCSSLSVPDADRW